jgi:hypothetical protein
MHRILALAGPLALVAGRLVPAACLPHRRTLASAVGHSPPSPDARLPNPRPGATPLPPALAQAPARSSLS